MHAIIKTGGKQYRVAKGDKIEVGKIDGATGDKVELETLMVDDKLNAGKTKATILNQGRDKKVIVFKKKRRQGYRRMNGHRQHHTLLEITDIAK